MAYADMYIQLMACARASVSGVYAHILREASALSVLLQWALPEPLQAERATVWLSRFFVYITNSLHREQGGFTIT